MRKCISVLANSTIFLGLALLSISNAAAEEPFQSPLFLTSKVRPIMMLNMSRDHQLFFKLYDDYADITDIDGGAKDGKPDVTYNNNYQYYGYFDANKCYKYKGEENLFVPENFTENHYCNGSQWSGNFLNWATMTRLDAVRKILYGGYRSTDTANSSNTVLERAFLPNDAHSFAKHYNGTDIGQLTPYPYQEGVDGLTMCNTSLPEKTLSHSHNTKSTPKLRLKRGNYVLWAASQRWQCLRENEFKSRGEGGSLLGKNKDKNTPDSGLNASADSPKTIDADMTLRVQVCVPELIDLANDEQCRSYVANGHTTYKPAGLLQEYGEPETIHFGLMTGSWGKNKSGGVLRKKVGSFTDEVNEDGTFKAAPASGGIVNTLNAISIHGYSFWKGEYLQNIDRIHCFETSRMTDGSDKSDDCVNWGNPQAEIYLESLRYLAGKESNPDFWTDDTTYFSSMTAVKDWVDPIQGGEDGNQCAPLNILQFNTSSSSYDTDELGRASTDFALDIDLFSQKIGEAEGIHGNKFFIADNGQVSDQKCTAKTVSNLGDVKGTCPEAPGLQGGYDIAGLAYWARKEGIGNDREKVKTFGVALAPATPQLEIPVPGKDQVVKIIPACNNTGRQRAALGLTSCAIVDFKVISQQVGEETSSGKVYVNWEDSEMGGDYDMDAWGTLSYEATSTTIKVTTDVNFASSHPLLGRMAFGYVINGTTQDGFHAHSGVYNYNFTDPTGVPGCSKCNAKDDPTSYTYSLGQSEAGFLEPALYYAAKWGGYESDDMTEEQIAARKPSNYFYATAPRELKESLNSAFNEVAQSVGSAASAAANSTRLSGDSLVYQARFDAEIWSGQVLAYSIDDEGNVDMTKAPVWDTNKTLTTQSERRIYTYDGNTVVSGYWNRINRQLVQLTDTNFDNGNLPSLKAALSADADDEFTRKRFKWLLGEDDELLRKRKYLLGDIVNSDPAYAGMNNQVFNRLPAKYGANSYLTYVRKKAKQKPILFVGANDGMLHALDAATGTELFAYIPRGAYGKLNGLMDIDFEHQFIVDGSLYVGDAYLNTGYGNEHWRTVVVGSLGYGGRGVFALDVTDVLNDPTKTPRVIFDFTSTDPDSPIADDLGFILNKPVVVPMLDGHWRAVFGNGVNSKDGTSKLIAINLDDPLDDTIVIDTKAEFEIGNDNGLSGISILSDSQGLAAYAYGGDILGNLWKFDVSSFDNESWRVAYGRESNPKPLIQVVDDENNRQPISTNPTLGYNYLKRSQTNSANHGVMVYFATGKYYTASDAVSDDVQSIYAIGDFGQPHELAWNHRTQFLHQKSIDNQTLTRRTISNDTNVNWKLMSGWFLDLVQPNDETNRERGISKALLIYNRLIIPTFTPSANKCEFGGSGWLMELSAINGVNDDDTAILGDESNRFLDSAIVSDLSPVVGKDEVFLFASTLGDGEEAPPLDKRGVEGLTGINGRVSWRELR